MDAYCLEKGLTSHAHRFDHCRRHHGSAARSMVLEESLYLRYL